MNNNQVTEQTLQTVALCRFGEVSPRLFEALLHHFGNVERIIKADSGTLMAVDGLDATTANQIAQVSERLDDTADYLDSLTQKNVAVVTRFDSDFPQDLFEINDPPPLLYVRGKLPANDQKRVAIAGTSEATSEGIALTVETAAFFARHNVSVMSSLSHGIDLSVHLGCRREKTGSYAVCDGGFESIRADDSVPVAIEISKSGGLISEHPPEFASDVSRYEQSNRILVGMAQAVIVTEVYAESERTLDLLKFCHQTGKLTFLLIDPQYGALSDEQTLNKAVGFGALPMVGLDKLEDILKSLV